MNPSLPYRLKSRGQEAVGLHGQMKPKGLFLFGLPFFSFGLYFALGSLGVIEFDERKVNGPMWLLTAAGLVFLLSGLMLWGMGLRQTVLLANIRRLARAYPNDAVIADYPWSREGYSPPRWAPVRKSAVGTLLIIVFASIPNCMVQAEGSAPLILRIMAILMNLIVIAVVGHLLKTVWHALKFGRTHLIYPKFPIRPGETVDFEIELPTRLQRAESATITLRCLKEFYETHGSGKNRSKRLVHEVLYEAVEPFDAERLAKSPGRIRLAVPLPEEGPGTQMQGEPVRFWELELALTVPGLDLNQRYLLPVYRA